jgi:hypothetical protein
MCFFFFTVSICQAYRERSLQMSSRWISSTPLCPPGALDTPSTSQNVTATSDDEALIDSIVSSSRQGRTLQQDGYNHVASDPQVRQAIEAGNDSEARHFIREKLCNLGLMAVSVTDCAWHNHLIATNMYRVFMKSLCKFRVEQLLSHPLHKQSVKKHLEGLFLLLLLLLLRALQSMMNFYSFHDCLYDFSLP